MYQIVTNLSLSVCKSGPIWSQFCPIYVIVLRDLISPRQLPLALLLVLIELVVGIERTARLKLCIVNPEW